MAAVQVVATKKMDHCHRQITNRRHAHAAVDCDGSIKYIYDIYYNMLY